MIISDINNDKKTLSCFDCKMTGVTLHNLRDEKGKKSGIYLCDQHIDDWEWKVISKTIVRKK